MSWARVLNLAAKALLLVLLLHAVVYADLAQYQHKGMGYRLVLYPIAAALVPTIWLLRQHRPTATHRRYPHLLDLFIVLPFLLDTFGNAANLYDTVTWFDDVMHVLTWIPLVVAFGLLLRYWPLGRFVTAALTIGFGALTHILWEIAEYLTFVADSPTESASAYRDTIGDLATSLLGSIIGATLVSTVLWTAGTAIVNGRPDHQSSRVSRRPSRATNVR
jgi:glycopeptide antibiotics resistance protein